MSRPKLSVSVLRDSRFLIVLTSIILGSLSTTSLHAQLLPQYDELRLRQMNYRNSSGERGLTVFAYGRDRVMRSAIWMLEDRSRYSCNYHLYDAAGNEVEKYREFSDGMTSTERYEYDPNGNRVAELFERSDGVSGRAGFLWDEDGHLVGAELDRYKGWLSAHIDYRYEGETRAGATISRGDQTIGEIQYVYDAAGHLIEETWDFGEWSQSFGYEYEAVPQKLLGFSNPLVEMNPRFVIDSEDYDFNGETGGPSHYSYDETGSLTTKVFERSDGLKTVTTFEYDHDGSLKTSHREYADGSSVEFRYSYDEALRLTEKTFTRSDGVSGFERYSYDRFGRLETAVYRNMDFWLSGTISVGYDAWGHLTAGHFAGEDGFDAELDIQTDTHGNVILVRWDFSFGKSQTYRFGYRPRT